MTDKKIEAEKRVKRVLYINHNLFPFEISGTPLSTLNHALGMAGKGLDVAVLIPEIELESGWKKEVNCDFILYKVPMIEKYTAYLGVSHKKTLSEYKKAIREIITDFAPQVVHINDYVFMSAEIVEEISNMGCIVVRNVCSCEELCHQDFPVITSGLDGQLCSGPEKPRKCSDCFIRLAEQSSGSKLSPDDKSVVKKNLTNRFDYIKRLYRNSVDKVIFTTRPFKDYFLRFVSIPEEKIKIIPRGFKFNYSRERKRKNKRGNVINFAYVGSISRFKGIDVMLRAFENVCKDHDFNLHIYGGLGNDLYRPWIERLQKYYHDKFIWHGPFKGEDLPRIGEEIDVCIIPSYFDTYNRVLREVLYMGIPVITTDFFGADIVHDGENGLKIKIGDADALTEKMINIIEDPNIIVKLRQGAAQTHIPTLQEEIDILIETYNDLYAQSEKKENSMVHMKMPDSKLASIIIPIEDKLESIKDCIRSIQEYTPETYEIIFVGKDFNNSTGKYLRSLRNNNDLQFINCEKCKNLANGINLAFSNARGEYILLLKSNTLVTGGWLKLMTGYLERNPDIGMVGPIFNGEKGPQSIKNVPYENDMTAMQDFAGSFTSGNRGKIKNVVKLAGHCLIMRKEIARISGGFDDKYTGESYKIDDLCLVSLLAGYKNIIAYDVFIHHNNVFNSGDSPDYKTAIGDMEYFAGKWQGIVDISDNGYSVKLSEEDQRNRLVGLGEDMLARGDNTAAAETFKRLYCFVKNDCRALNNLGVIQWQLGEKESAIKSFQTAIKLNPCGEEICSNFMQAAKEFGSLDITDSAIPEFL